MNFGRNVDLLFINMGLEILNKLLLDKAIISMLDVWFVSGKQIVFVLLIIIIILIKDINNEKSFNDGSIFSTRR